MSVSSSKFINYSSNLNFYQIGYFGAKQKQKSVFYTNKTKPLLDLNKFIFQARKQEFYMLGGSRKDRAFINLEETNEKRSREMLKLLYIIRVTQQASLTKQFYDNVLMKIFETRPDTHKNGLSQLIEQIGIKQAYKTYREGYILVMYLQVQQPI